MTEEPELNPDEDRVRARLLKDARATIPDFTDAERQLLLNGGRLVVDRQTGQVTVVPCRAGHSMDEPAA